MHFEVKISDFEVKISDFTYIELSQVSQKDEVGENDTRLVRFLSHC